jgi:phosphopantetheine adenylyltransferase
MSYPASWREFNMLLKRSFSFTGCLYIIWTSDGFVEKNENSTLETRAVSKK